MVGNLSNGPGRDGSGAPQSDRFRWDTVGYTGRFADPSITMLPDGTDAWVAAYSANTSGPDDRFSCIGLAHATAPLGPYTPTSQTEPLTCFKPEVSAGAIDPDFFTDPATGRTWLLWKQEGVRDRPWEETVVENLSMVVHASTSPRSGQSRARSSSRSSLAAELAAIRQAATPRSRAPGGRHPRSASRRGRSR